MRRPRSYDAELKALEDRARELKARRVRELGELVIATGADALAPEELAGALLVLAEANDSAKREAWAKRGAAMFVGRGRARGRTRRTAPATDRDGKGSAAPPGGDAPASGGLSEA